MILTTDQKRHLTQVEQTKNRCVTDREVARRVYDDAIAYSKDRLRLSVASALKAGVPQRQIHISAGYTRGEGLAQYLGVTRLADLTAPQDTIGTDGESIEVRPSNHVPTTLDELKQVVVTQGFRTCYLTDSMGVDWVIKRWDIEKDKYIVNTARSLHHGEPPLTKEVEDILLADCFKTAFGSVEEWPIIQEGGLTDRQKQWAKEYDPEKLQSP